MMADDLALQGPPPHLANGSRGGPTYCPINPTASQKRGRSRSYLRRRKDGAEPHLPCEHSDSQRPSSHLSFHSPIRAGGL